MFDIVVVDEIYPGGDADSRGGLADDFLCAANRHPVVGHRAAAGVWWRRRRTPSGEIVEINFADACLPSIAVATAAAGVVVIYLF